MTLGVPRENINRTASVGCAWVGRGADAYPQVFLSIQRVPSFFFDLHVGWFLAMSILLMEEISNNHLGCKKTLQKWWDKLPIYQLVIIDFRSKKSPVGGLIPWWFISVNWMLVFTGKKIRCRFFLKEKIHHPSNPKWQSPPTQPNTQQISNKYPTSQKFPTQTNKYLEKKTKKQPGSENKQRKTFQLGGPINLAEAVSGWLGMVGNGGKLCQGFSGRWSSEGSSWF